MQTLIFFDLAKQLLEQANIREMASFLRGIITGGNFNMGEGDDRKPRFAQFMLSLGITGRRLRADHAMDNVARSLGVGSDVITETYVASLLTLFMQQGQTSNLSNKRELWEFLARLEAAISLVDNAGPLLAFHKESGPAVDDWTVVRLQVLDPTDEGIEVERLSEILRSLSRLCSLLSEITKEEGEAKIAYLDSGSDVGIGLLLKGVTAALLKASLTDLLLRARFWREDGIDRRLETLVRAIPVIQEVQRGEADGLFAPEDSRRLQSGITAEIMKLFGYQVHVELGTDVNPGPTSFRDVMLQAASAPRLSPPEGSGGDTA